MDNPLITSESRATAIGEWVENYMKNRIVLDMSWRVDPRIDALDVITNDNGYNVNNVIMTSVNFKYNGAFRGTLEGCILDIPLDSYSILGVGRLGKMMLGGGG